MGDIGVLKISYMSPANGETKVSPSTDIRVTFNLDVDMKSIVDAITVLDYNSKQPVIGSLSYDRFRTLIFIPAHPLHTSTTYQVVVSSKVKSILGQSLRGMECSFTTGTSTNLDVPLLISPALSSSSPGTPTFTWSSVTDAVGYFIQVSPSELFPTISWETQLNCPKETTTRQVSVIPEIQLDEMTTYYWRVKAINDILPTDPDYCEPAWSEVYRFYIVRENNPILVPEDISQDPLFGIIAPPSLKVNTTFPEDKFSNVGCNINTLWAEIEGIIDNPTRLDPRKWLVEGRHVLDNDNFYMYDPTAKTKVTVNVNHGQVTGRWSVIIDSDNNKSYIIFNPDKL